MRNGLWRGRFFSLRLTPFPRKTLWSKWECCIPSMHHESGEERRTEGKNQAFFLFGEFIHLALEIFVWEKRGNGPTMKTISKKSLLRFWASRPKHYTVYGWPRRTVIRLALEPDDMMWNENIGLVLLMTTSMSKLFFFVTKARTSLSILYKSERDSLILHSSKS